MSTFIIRFDGPPTTSGADAVRVAVKDLIDLVGVPTTNASKVIAAVARPAEADAPCIRGTREAEHDGRAWIVGKTNLHELAFGVTGINPWFGTPVNPLDPRLVPGGSSSGSAVAVATGDADVAFGSDTGGSVRIPAACCGVVGLKTTRGRVSLEGVLPLAPSLDTVGPMGATVDATALGMALLEPGFVIAESPARRVGRVRVPAEPWVDNALDAALAAAGFEVVEFDMPGWEAATDANMLVIAAEAWAVHSALWQAHAAELSPDVGERLFLASSVTADDVAAAWAQARLWDAELATAFESVDLLALPTLGGSPPTLEEGSSLTGIRHVAPFNISGLPALAMPVATPGRPEGAAVPASLQLAGPAGSEALLLASAALVESAAPWRTSPGLPPDEKRG